MASLVEGQEGREVGAGGRGEVLLFRFCSSWAPKSGEKSEFRVNAQNGPKISRKSEQMLAQALLKGFPSVQAAATPWIMLETSLLPNP